MKTGRRAVLAGMLGVAVSGLLPALPAKSEDQQPAVSTLLKLDFGGTNPPPALGYTRALTTHTYNAARGWGWVSNAGLASRDRGGAPLQRDFVFLNTTAARVFRIGNLQPGRYRLTIMVGDLTFSDHYTRITVAGTESSDPLPVLRPLAGQWATLTFTAVVPFGQNTLDVTFDASQVNWVVNSLVLETVVNPERPRATVQVLPPVSQWKPLGEDPTAALLAGHRERVADNWDGYFRKTRLTRDGYLELIAGQVDFWKTLQNAQTGAIIDPYRNGEFQYSTPAYAHAAATLVAYAGRGDLLESAAKALDWSALRLSQRRAASGHEDFYAPMLAHAIRLLKPFVPAERSAAWEYNIWYFEPFLVYRYGPGVNNWNVVAASGEALFQAMGIRDANHQFVEASFAAQGRHFDSPYGLYTEGPTAYDLFPRLWVNDLLARGYNGPYRTELEEALRRGALTSLFLQSPLGELPAGGRSAHHQWNEAQQCATFEIYAAKALAAGDQDLAAYFKRAAHLSMASMQRWVRPSGEMQIVKNWVDPSQQHGYETYSAHSQYNLLPMSMLAIAYEHAAATECVDEQPAPADAGGYVLHLEELHKVIANCEGAYVELDTAGDHHYDATGLIRAHFAAHPPQLGPSDSLLADPSYVVPAGSPVPPTTGIGVAWLGDGGAWKYQGALEPAEILAVSVSPAVIDGKKKELAFSVRYEGAFGGGVSVIEEQYLLTRDDVTLKTVLPGYNGPVQRLIPVLAHDGRTESEIELKQNDREVRVSQRGEYDSVRQTFEMEGAASLTVGEELYPNHNGWARLAVAEYPAPGSGGKKDKDDPKGGESGATGVTLRIRPKGGRPIR